MKNLKKLSRIELKQINGGNAPADVKCSTLICLDTQQCCFSVSGQFYFCHSINSQC